MIRRFLGGLISSPAMVIDLQAGGRRLAVGALLDRLGNPSNNACLEVLGMAPECDPAQVLSTLVGEARGRLPAHKAGFQVTFGEQNVPPPEWLERYRLRPGYEVFEMVCAPVLAPTLAAMPGVAVYTPADDRELDRVLRESFRESLDMFISPFEEWHAGNEAHPPRGFVFRTGAGEAQGFVHFHTDAKAGEADIHILGVLSAVRRRGIGRALLGAALRSIAEEGIRTCKLTAGTRNRSALSLYQAFGFVIAGKKSIFTGTRDSEH
jgi:ribosomal protein S18 acetylase RimI-like enzyme